MSSIRGIDTPVLKVWFCSLRPPSAKVDRSEARTFWWLSCASSAHHVHDLTLLQQRWAARGGGLPASPPCAQEPTVEGAWQTWRPSVQASTAPPTVPGNRLFSKTPGSGWIVVPSRAGIQRFTPEGRDVAPAAADPTVLRLCYEGSSRPGSFMPWAPPAKFRGGRGAQCGRDGNAGSRSSLGGFSESEVTRASTPRPALSPLLASPMSTTSSLGPLASSPHPPPTALRPGSAV